MNRIIIAGGSGFLGQKLAASLRQKKYSVEILSRRPGLSDMNNLIADRIHLLDYNVETMKTCIDGAHAVINLAGASIGARRWTKEYKKMILQSRLITTELISRAIESSDNPPRVFISASAIGYYGDTVDVNLDENSPPGADFLAGVCSEWESTARRVESYCRLVIPRIGIVLDKNNGALPKMITPYKYYFGGRLGNGRQWMSWIHVDDLINLILWSLENENIAGTVNAVSPNPITMSVFSRILAEVLQKPACAPVPAFILKLLLGEPSILVLGSQKVVPAVALNQGFEFRFQELKTALEDIIL